jgi:PAS domain S-box-containing protein
LQALSPRFGQAIERLVAREEAQNQRRNLEGFVQTLRDHVVVVNEQTRIVYFNPAMREQLGYDDTLLGQPVLTIHPPQVAPASQRGGRSRAQRSASIRHLADAGR